MAEEFDDAEDAQNSANTVKRIGTPWPKGVSGNPGGRPKRKPVSEIYSRIFDDPDFAVQFEAQVKKQVLKGGMAAMFQAKEMADRVEGKVPSKVTVDGEFNLTISERLKKAKERKQR